MLQQTDGQELGGSWEAILLAESCETRRQYVAALGLGRHSGLDNCKVSIRLSRHDTAKIVTVQCQQCHFLEVGLIPFQGIDRNQKLLMNIIYQWSWS